MFLRVLLNRAPTPLSSIYLHLPPPSSTHLRPAHISLKPALCKTINVIVTKILHLIWQFPQFRPKKISKLSVWLKIGTHGILEVQIPNPDLGFWNSDSRIEKSNLGRKSQSSVTCVPIFLKIGTHFISVMLILTPTVFWISDPKSIFRQI